MWRKLFFDENFDRATRNILQSGIGKVDTGSGLIVPVNIAMGYDSNWLFSGYTTSLRDCRLWHSIMFNHYNIVPEFCKLRCYKVVIKVRNFLEAMQLYGLMCSSACINAETAPIHGKVGMDERSYSDGTFNGFVYCDGLEDALEKYQMMRKLVDENMEGGENINIIVKRSCTEFEKRFGPTDNEFWQKMTKQELNIQHRIEDMFAPEWSSSVQPDWLKNKIIYRFIEWANKIGDKSWIGVYGPDTLTMKAVTYHHLAKGDIENGSSKD